MKKYMSLILVLLLVGCGSLGTSSTPFVKPQAKYINTDLAEVSNELVAGCMEAGGTIQPPSQNLVTCELAMGSAASFTEELLYGNYGNNPPSIRAQFILYKKGPYVVVIGNQWIVTHNSHGEKLRPTRDRGTAVKMQLILNGIGTN